MAKKLKEYAGTVGHRADGAPILKTFYGLTKAEAKEKAARYVEEHDLIEDRVYESEFYFKGWAQHWLLTYKKPFVEQNAYYTTYESIVYQHLLPYFGNRLLADIERDDILAFYSEKSSLSKSMCSKISMNLNAIFETAIDNERCFRNPARFTRLLSKRLPNIKEVYDDEQIVIAERWFIQHMPEVVLILETGVRRGEMCGWYKDDFDLRRRLYSVNRAIVATRGGVLKEKPPKNKSFRTNPLSPVAAQAYRILCERNPASRYLVSGEDGGPLHPEQWSSDLKTAMRHLAAEREDMPELTAHELRHTYGTFLRRHNVDIYTIAKVLGHKSIEVTGNTYVHNEIGVLRKALKFINRQELIA